VFKKHIFTIKNLFCAYKKQLQQPKVVVKVQTLNILKGKITVLLGKSGSGKSTLLETLGLMNNTIVPKSNTQLLFTPNNNEVAFSNLWANKQQLAMLRRQHFSFIFQNTNLMPNFTAYENICLTQMLQGKSQKRAFQVAKSMMQQLGMTHIDTQKMPTQMSGGEKQRVAFIRAISPNFTVLFADEPTGNLDDQTAHNLMEIIVNVLKNDSNKTAIIVTHNLNLALKYASQIVVITKSKSNTYGQVTADNTFVKMAGNYWQNELCNEFSSSNLQGHLQRLMS